MIPFLKQLFVPAVVLAMLFLLIFLFGQSKEKTGFLLCQNAQKEAFQDQSEKNRKDADRIAKDEESTPDIGLDARLAALGILRRNEDR